MGVLMKKNIVRFSLVGALAVGSMGTLGCSDETLALGAGVVLGSVVAGSASRDRTPPRHRHHPGHRGGRYAMEMSVESLEAQAASEHFQISPAAAGKIVSALRAARDGDFSQMIRLGLTRDDVRTLALGENPSVSTLRGLSENLDLELSEVHSVIQQVKLDLVDAGT